MWGVDQNVQRSVSEEKDVNGIDGGEGRPLKSSSRRAGLAIGGDSPGRAGSLGWGSGLGGAALADGDDVFPEGLVGGCFGIGR